MTEPIPPNERNEIHGPREPGSRSVPSLPPDDHRPRCNSVVPVGPHVIRCTRELSNYRHRHFAMIEWMVTTTGGCSFLVFDDQRQDDGRPLSVEGEKPEPTRPSPECYPIGNFPRPSETRPVFEGLPCTVCFYPEYTHQNYLRDSRIARHDYARPEPTKKRGIFSGLHFRIWPWLPKPAQASTSRGQ